MSHFCPITSLLKETWRTIVNMWWRNCSFVESCLFSRLSLPWVFFQLRLFTCLLHSLRPVFHNNETSANGDGAGSASGEPRRSECSAQEPKKIGGAGWVMRCSLSETSLIRRRVQMVWRHSSPLSPSFRPAQIQSGLVGGMCLYQAVIKNHYNNPYDMQISTLMFITLWYKRAQLLHFHMYNSLDTVTTETFLRYEVVRYRHVVWIKPMTGPGC